MTSARQSDAAKRLQNIEQLHSVVTAIRSIAAGRVQQARAILQGVDSYARIIDEAIGTALALRTHFDEPSANAGNARPGVILFCAEQGFVGTYNERVFDEAGPALEDNDIFLIGSRGLITANDRALKPLWHRAAPVHAGTIGKTVSALTDALFGHIETTRLTHVSVVAPAAHRGNELERYSLIPLDYSRFSRPSSAGPPLTNLLPEALMERLVMEYVYADLFAAAARNFIAENESRMIKMTSAKANVEKRLAELTLEDRRIRQEDTTAEVIELSAGAGASRRSRTHSDSGP